jgi:hypothetical protein
MKEQILQHIKEANALEVLYQKDKAGFRNAFLEAASEMPAGKAKDFWMARLEKSREGISWGSLRDWLMVLVAGLAGGLVIKLPTWFSMELDNFFPRNLTFVFVPSLLLFFGVKSGIRRTKFVPALAVLLLSGLWINVHPGRMASSDSLILACLHLPLLFWLLLAYADASGEIKALKPRLNFIRFSAEWLVMSGLVLAAAGLFSGLILGLFQTIGIPLDKYYFDYFAVFGVGAIQVVAALLLKENPDLLKQVAPVVAGIFSPLALFALLIFLPALLISGKNLFADREFLLIFNLLLMGVIALIFFSLPEITKNPQKKFGLLVLTGLSVLTLLINGFAVSAILYRIISFGITINRAAVLGSNLLILANLLLMCRNLLKAIKNPAHLNKAEDSVARFLPVYGFWAVVVIFLFPMVFGFH